MIYTSAGLVLSAFYAPQIVACLRDDHGLSAYSLQKALVQLVCRAAMMPFVWITVDSVVMLSIQGLDLGLRAAELAVAVWSLKRQGWTWPQIARRSVGRSAVQPTGALRAEGV
ncbi:MAG: hypothetical protein HZA63_14080 [Rhodocyclales bacterium]|nr:hypothetical protein [Rhodocyclales bacterium]